MEFRIEKTDYPPGVGPEDGHNSEFEVVFSSDCYCFYGIVTRKKLEKLHKQLGILLATDTKPRYTVRNRSSLAVILEVGESKEEPDR